jgi:epoxyqueuosine reductase
MRPDPATLGARAKQLALDAGFDLAGIARPDAPAELRFFAEWVGRGHAGEMRYLTEQVEKRSDLRTAFPWARSVVCVGLQYDTAAPYSTEAPADRGWISRYAWGDDYHDVMGAMLERLVSALRTEAGPFECRAYVDTGPVVERAYAAAAGLGAWGKNTCLLHPEHGSWFFLGELVTDLELLPDTPRTDMCGSCTACLDACPTGAFPEPFVLDATRCISYLTIELRGAIPEEQRAGVGRHVFGCDICQDVCPWNRRRRRQGGAAFAPRPAAMAPDLGDLAALDPEAFAARFRRSPVKRAKRRGFLRNVALALGNSGDRSKRPMLERLAQDEDPLVREHAEWALRRLEAPKAD